MSRRSPSCRSTLQGREILLVEDESLIVFDVTRALEREGARVIGAANVAQALERLDTHRPDAAVLDLKLDRGESSERIAARLDELRIPYLIHTGDALRHVELLERIAAPRLSKPYPSHFLVARVSELLEPRPATDGPSR